MLGCLDIQLATCQPFRSYPRPSARSSLLIYHGFHVCRSDRDRGEGCTISSGCIPLDETVHCGYRAFFPPSCYKWKIVNYTVPFTVDNNAIIKRTRLFVTTFRPVETKMEIGCYVTVCSFFRWKNGGTV